MATFLGKLLLPIVKTGKDLLGGILGAGLPPPTTYKPPPSDSGYQRSGFVSGGVNFGKGINPLWILIGIVIIALTALIGWAVGRK